MTTTMTMGTRFGLVMLLLFSSLAMVSPAWAQDSLGEADYEAGQDALDDQDYRAAARYFRRVHDRHPDATFAPSAMYWHAFALYRMGAGPGGSLDELEEAGELLEEQAERYPDHPSRDREQLWVRIGESMARRGDEDADRRVRERAEDSEGTGDLQVRIAAINALMNMDSEKAVPLLKEVLQQHDPEYDELREKAVFIIAQHEAPDTEEILLMVAKDDPSREVRKQAVFWLHQVSGPRAVAALEEILRSSEDPEIQEQAIFSLAQHGGERSSEILRDIVGDPSFDKELRANAIFWLGQEGGRREIEFLKEQYAALDDEELKDKVIFSVSQGGGRDASAWLLTIAKDPTESIEMRKQALFWAGQSGHIDIESLMEIYSSADDEEIKKQIIFVLSQYDERESLDALMRIVREEEDVDLKTDAIFWIGQSDDPRAPEILEELIKQ